MRNPLSIVYTWAAQRFAQTPLGGWYPVKIVGYAVARLAKKRKVTLHGNTLYLDKADSNRMSIRGEYDPLETKLVQALVRPGDVVVDLGANVGYYTLLCASLAGEEGTVFAFEPDPENLALLEKNINVNGYSNVVVAPLAVSNEAGRVGLHREATNTATPSLWKSAHVRSSVEVETVRLDDYFEAHAEAASRVRLIKMDIEGAEGLALEGMAKTLEKNDKMAILTEYLPTVLGFMGTDPRVFLETLQNHGFTLYDVNVAAGRLIPIDVPSFCEEFDQVLTNILCLKGLDVDALGI